MIIDRIRDTNRLILWFIIMLAGLMPITYIGWLVHYHFLNDLGLPHLMSWAIPYWIAEMLAVAFYGVTSAAGYWLLADETKRARITMFLLGLTVFWQWGCGTFDWLWFILHKLKGFPFPALDQIWWWNPYYWFLGINWTTLHHIIYTIILEAVLLAIWIIWYVHVHSSHEEATSTV